MRKHRGKDRNSNLWRKKLKRAIAFFLILSVLLSLSAETITHSSFKYQYEEYTDEEFPIWTMELRRAETIFFGSFVFTVPFSALVFSTLGKYGVLNYSSPSTEALYTLGGAAGLSLVVAGLDWVLGRIGE